MGTFLFLNGTHSAAEVELCKVLAVFYKAKKCVPQFLYWPCIWTLVSLLTKDSWMWRVVAHANFPQILNAIDAIAGHVGSV